VVQVEKALALHLLSHRAQWTDPQRLNTVASVFLMFTWRPPEVLDASFEGLAQKNFKVDAKLVSDLYYICPPALKVGLASTSAFRCLDPSTFKRLFLDAWGVQELGSADRVSLLYSLHSYLDRNPKWGSDYAEVILEGLRSKQWKLHIPGFLLAGYLDHLPTAQLLQLKRGMLSPRPELRMHAHNGLCLLIKRRREVSPAVIAFCLEPELQATAQRLQKSDPDEGVQLCAFYLVKALRAARKETVGTASPTPRASKRKPSRPR